MSKLTELRSLHGWNQSQAASFLGCDRTQVNKWERGHVEPGRAVQLFADIGLHLTTTAATACLGFESPANPLAELERVLGSVAAAWILSKGQVPKGVPGRLAVVVAFAATFEPAALDGLYAAVPVETTAVDDKPVAPSLKQAVDYRYLYLSGRRRVTDYRTAGDEANAIVWEAQVGEIAERARAAGEDVSAWDAMWNASNPTGDR